MTPNGPISHDDRGRTVPVIDEALDVDTVLVDKGGYRLTKEISTRHEIVDELTHLHQAHIERHPIGRELDADEVPEPRYEGDTLIVPVVEEILVTRKKLFLLEEIRITRKRSTTSQPRSFTLRREEIQIERLEADPSAPGVSQLPPDNG